MSPLFYNVSGTHNIDFKPYRLSFIREGLNFRHIGEVEAGDIFIRDRPSAFVQITESTIGFRLSETLRPIITTTAIRSDVTKRRPFTSIKDCTRRRVCRRTRSLSSRMMVRNHPGSFEVYLGTSLFPLLDSRFITGGTGL